MIGEPRIAGGLLQKKVCDKYIHGQTNFELSLARFLFQLGLKRQPPLQDLIKLASDSDEALRSAAFRYFLDNITKYPDYDPIDFKDVDFIPALSTDGSATIGSPSRVYTDSDSANFGFLVVHPSIRDVATEKLKLRKYPPTSLLLPILESTPPKEITDARKWFEILAGRLSGKFSLIATIT